MQTKIPSGFVLTINANPQPDDTQIEALLHDVYVGEGYTTPALAQQRFKAQDLRAQGDLFAILEARSGQLAGMIFLIPPLSAARRIAGDKEAELQLLAVHPRYRQMGLGEYLLQQVLNASHHRQYAAILLWTQDSMLAAQTLYRKCGFQFKDTFVQNGRTFNIFCYDLNSEKKTDEC